MTGIVQHTSSTVVSVLNGISTAAMGLDMLENYVQDAKVRQLDASKVSMLNYRKQLLLTASAERVRLEEQIAAEMHNNTQRKAHFDGVYSELAALFD
jgi:propanediol utilization protein